MTHYLLAVHGPAEMEEFGSYGSKEEMEEAFATTEVFKDREGQKKEDTQWHRVILWGKTAETLQDYLTKGKQIYVEGKLQTRKWKDKDGNDKYTTEIRGDRVVLLSGGGRGDGAGRGEGGGGRSIPADDFGHPEPGGSVELTDDDIPF